MTDRWCEQPDCDVNLDPSYMILLFRECWYCPDHALVQLQAALGERDLTDDERELLADLGGAAHAA
ncbi:MAG: hypothetical protein HYT80_00530 [Euryarchaeota archaeon]|nr:hypothetical protein [Euryarchaeota archaeon]